MVIFVLGLKVYDQANRFSRAGSNGAEADIVGDCPLINRFVLRIQAIDQRPFFIRQYRNAGHLGLALDVFFLNVPHRAVLMFCEAGFHDPG